MTYRASRILAFALLVGCCGLVACGGGDRLVTSSPEAAYERGAQLFERGRYARATEQLLLVFDFGRAHEYAADAQYLLAESYYLDGQYLLAANEYDRFIQLYRGDPRVEEGEYKRALSYYHQSPPYNRDQTDTERAITFLRLFIERYPDSPYAQDAGVKVVELQEKLAHKMFSAAAMYERQTQYEAAALTYRRVLDLYPNTSWADDALLGEMRSYLAFSDRSVVARQPERIQKAIEAYELLIQIFPDSPVLKEAEELYAEAVSRLDALAGV